MEAARLLDLPQYRLGQLLAQPIEEDKLYGRDKQWEASRDRLRDVPGY
jgi:hypothetical protein